MIAPVTITAPRTCIGVSFSASSPTASPIVMSGSRSSIPTNSLNDHIDNDYNTNQKPNRQSIGVLITIRMVKNSFSDFLIGKTHLQLKGLCMKSMVAPARDLVSDLI